MLARWTKALGSRLMRLVEWSNARPRVRFVVLGLLVVAFLVMIFRGLLAPSGGQLWDGDYATATTFAELRGYLALYSGPWYAGSVTGGFNPFFSNDLAMGSLLLAFGWVLGSPGNGSVAVMVFIEGSLFVSLFLSARRMGAAPPWAVIAASAFATSPLVFDRTVAGHELILAATALLPPFLALLLEASTTPLPARSVGVLGFLWAGIGILEYHVFYLSCLVWATTVVGSAVLSIVRARGTEWRSHLRRWARPAWQLVGAAAIALGVNSFWIIPAFRLASSSRLAEYSGVTTRWTLSYSQNGVGLWSVLSADVYVPHWYGRAWSAFSGPTTAAVVTFLLVALLIGGLVWQLGKRSPRLLLLGSIVVVFLVLSTGTVGLGASYLWMVDHVPLFAVNDDPAKFDLVALPGLCLMLALALQEAHRITGVPNPSLSITQRPWRIRGRRRAGYAALFGAALIILVCAVPWATGDLNGYVAHAAYAPGAQSAASSLDASVGSSGRVALFPPDPFGYNGSGQPPTNPLVVYPPGSVLFLPSPPGLEPMNAATRVAAMAYTAIYAGSTDHAASLMGLLGATAWEVNLGASPSPAGSLYGWDTGANLSAALSQQVDLPAPQTFGEYRVYSTSASAAPTLALEGLPVLILGDDYTLLEAAYLPNGDRWIASTPFALVSPDPAAPAALNPATGGSPYLETPEGALGAMFAQLPSDQRLPLEPLAWSALSHQGLDLESGWTPWEYNTGLDAGRLLANEGGWIATHGSSPFLVPLPNDTSAGSGVWLDLAYGPEEGTMVVTFSSGRTVTIDAHDPVAAGFEWTFLGPSAGLTSMTLRHVGGRATAAAEVAVASPGELAASTQTALSWIGDHGGGPGDPAVLWIKGDTGVRQGNWSYQWTGPENAAGWENRIGSNGSLTTTFLLPFAQSLGILARGNGTGGISVTACAGTSLLAQAPASCAATATVSFAPGTPQWVVSAGTLNVGPGVVTVTVRAAPGGARVDQVLLTPSPSRLDQRCPVAAAGTTDWLCSGSVQLPTKVSGNIGGPELLASFVGAQQPSVLVHLVSCDAEWTANGVGVSSAPSVVDGWACGYLAQPGFSEVHLSVTGVVSATWAGDALSVAVAIPAMIWVAGVAPPRWLRRTGRGVR